MSIRIAVIGLGIIGRRMIEQSRLHGGLNVACAWDSSAVACATAEHDYPGLVIVQDVDAMIRRADIDLVYVAVPPLAHHAYVVAAADAGKAVFCEKPLTVSQTQGQALVDLARTRQLRHAVNYVFASSHAVAAIAQRIRAPEFELQSIAIRMRFFEWPRAWQASAAWLNRADQGGPTREVLSHYVYLLLALFGKVKLLTACVRRQAPEAAEHFSHASFDAQGTPVSLACHVGGAAPDEVLVQFHGAAQTLELANWYELNLLENGQRHPVAGLPADPRQATYQAQLQQLCELMAGRQHSLPSFAVAFEVQQIIEAILTSDVA